MAIKHQKEIISWAHNKESGLVEFDTHKADWRQGEHRKMVHNLPNERL